MRVLVITHTFPPSSSSNAKRPGILVKHMLDSGWEVEVLTSWLGMSRGQEEVLDRDCCQINRLRNFSDSVARSLSAGSRIELILVTLMSGIMFPDIWMPWSRFACRVARERKPHVDRILAFVHPPSLLLSGCYGDLVDSKWVFDFQESVSPQYKLYPRQSPLQRWWTPRLERLERSTLHRSGGVVFTAETNRRAYLKADLVKEGATHHIPYFYDLCDFRDDAAVSGDFEIGYFGNFDSGGRRTPAVFLQALAGFLRKRPEARSRTRFVFFGTWLKRHDRYLEGSDLGDIVKIHQGISHLEYLKRIQSTRVLLLVASSGHNLFMPSKIVDYFGAQRPILAFVPPDSEMHNVMLESGMGDFTCPEDDIQSGVLAIERLWELYLAGNLECESSKTSRWSSDIQIPRYLKFLQGESLE